MSNKCTYAEAYWTDKGKYQELYDQLYKQLVPKEDKASTVAGEMLRVVSNVYYDVYNNGGCNLRKGWGRHADKKQLYSYLSDADRRQLSAALKSVRKTSTGILQQDVDTLERIVDLIILKAAQLSGVAVELEAQPSA